MRRKFAILEPSTNRWAAAMKAPALAIVLLATSLLPACGSLDPKEAAAREWQRSECDRVVDRDDRERCLKRADH